MTIVEYLSKTTVSFHTFSFHALANTPERGENGYSEAIDFVESVCNVGTTALAAEDDKTEGRKFR
jgi:hypothetical protein